MTLTCSVVIYSKRDRCVRLCHKPAAFFIEQDGVGVVFATCKRHRERVNKMLGIAARPPSVTST